MYDCEISVFTIGGCHGVYNAGGNLKMINCEILTNSTEDDSFGVTIHKYTGLTELYDSTIKTSVGRFNYGICVGGSSLPVSNAIIYIDNCNIDGKITLNGTNGEQNNKLYMSNSKINTEQIIDIGEGGHKLYIGKGNNFTKENTNRASAVIETNDVYRQD